MSYPNRGEIWLVNLDPTVGSEIRKTRPALIISNDINNEYSDTLTIIPISDRGSKIYPFEVFLPKEITKGVIKDSKIRCQQIRTVDKLRLVKFLGSISEKRLEEVEKAILVHLGIEK